MSLESKVQRSRSSVRPKRAMKSRMRQEIVGELSREAGMVAVARKRVVNPPRAIQDAPLRLQRFRFRRGGVQTAVITGDCMANLIVNSTGSTTFRRLLGTLRIVKVELWTSVQANASGSNNAQLLFFPNLGGDSFDQGPPEVFEAISSGQDQPGHVSVRPGALTKLGRTMNVGPAAITDVLFKTQGSDGDLLEITVEYTLLDAVIENGRTLTGSGGSSGYIGYNTYLDNTSTSGTTGSQQLTNVTGFFIVVAIG